MSASNIPLFTYEDYKSWKGDWELIAGHPIAMSPSSVKQHQRVARNLVFAIMTELKKQDDCNCKLHLDSSAIF